ncbi:hypothetical protein E2562_000372 [Oryza meyeriana var. granulata]|uniref:Uncharacterized protein n=1 Tax=Oryza meyeriana var. granulata TaxID=110450 RepID=A0A6G1CD02_9ORYZ|nr:hypothetical protein E2562_000372 [Oryza meyeriana var. granulata]
MISSSPFEDESDLTNGHLDTTVIDCFLGMPPISLRDVSSYIRTTDPDNIGLRFTEAEVNNCTKARALILNTFDDLQADVLVALHTDYPRIFTIGTLLSLHRHLVDDNVDPGVGATGDLSLPVE